MIKSGDSVGGSWWCLKTDEMAELRSGSKLPHAESSHRE